MDLVARILALSYLSLGFKAWTLAFEHAPTHAETTPDHYCIHSGISIKGCDGALVHLFKPIF